MDFNPYRSRSNFVDLLQSQQSVFGSSEVPIFGTQQTVDSNLGPETSHATESKASAADDCTNCPSGVKASKARGKKTVDGKAADFQSMWSIKQQVLLAKKELYKMSLLDNLLAKREPLSESEEALKTKLIENVLSV
ncbi:hypothetical protein YC2023_113750 [Brassica napus]